MYRYLFLFLFNHTLLHVYRCLISNLVFLPLGSFQAAIPAPDTAHDGIISYSSNPTHALRDTAELLTGTSYDDHTFVLGEDGWIMGPNRRLLFWVPPASQKALRYNPRTTFAIPRGVELDLSRMAHGTRWQDCYKDSSLR